jgi:hypothetical protein
VRDWRLTHEPLGRRSTVLEIRVRRYRCTTCAHVWRQDATREAEPRSKLSRRTLAWALEGMVIAHLSVARITEAPAVSWNTANDTVPAQGQRVLIEDPCRFEGVKVMEPFPVVSLAGDAPDGCRRRVPYAIPSCSSPKSAMSLSDPPKAATYRASTS